MSEPKLSYSSPGGLLVSSNRKLSDGSFSSPLKRTESLVSRASSRIVSALGKPIEDHEYARTTMQSYFPQIPPNFGDMSLEVKNIMIKALKTNMGSSAIPRWNKLRGTLRVGVGRLHLLIKKKKKVQHWLFDVGLIKDITLKSVHSKSVTISFHTRGILLRLVFHSDKDCKDVVQNILYEAQFLSNCFNKVLKKNCNHSWMKVMKLDKFYDESHDIREITEAELTDDETADLIVDENLLAILEKCLREEIDLNVLGRGETHPESSDSMERLGLFLKRNIRNAEADHWFQRAVQTRKDFMKRNRGEALMGRAEEKAETEDVKKDTKPIDEIRFDLKKNLASLDYSVRIEAIEKRLSTDGSEQTKTKPAEAEKHDEFEDLL